MYDSSTDWPARLVWKTRLKGERCDQPDVLDDEAFLVEPRTWFVRTALLGFGAVMFIGVGCALAVGGVMVVLERSTAKWPGPVESAGVVIGGLLLSFFPVIGIWIALVILGEWRRQEVVLVRSGELTHFVRGIMGWRCVRVPLGEIRYTTIGPLQALWRNGKLMDRTGVVVRTTRGRVHLGLMHQGQDAWKLLDQIKAFEQELRVSLRFRGKNAVDAGESPGRVGLH